MRRKLRCGLACDWIANVLFALVIFLPGIARCQVPGPEIVFSVARDGEFVIVEARVDLPVPRATAWAVLTDYERYPRFISTMRESKISARGPDGLVIDQKGSFGFLFFSQEIEVRILVSEVPQTVVVARSIRGSFRDMHGRYELQPSATGVRLSYSGRFVPEFSLPPLIGTSIVHYAMEKNFREMVEEILRRVPAGQGG